MSTTLEIEVKGRLAAYQLSQFQTWLRMNCVSSSQEEQIDIYMDRKSEGFWPTQHDGRRDGKDFLRIRKSNSTSVTFKRWKADGSGALACCEEHTFVVDDYEKTLSLFQALGYFPSVEVSKKRRYYHFPNVEVAIDDVQGLGTFFEVEWIDSCRNIETAQKQIDVFLVSAGIRRYWKMKRGYVSMILNPEVDFSEEVRIKDIVQSEP